MGLFPKTPAAAPLPAPAPTPVDPEILAARGTAHLLQYRYVPLGYLAIDGPRQCGKRGVRVPERAEDLLRKVVLVPCRELLDERRLSAARSQVPAAGDAFSNFD